MTKQDTKTIEHMTYLVPFNRELDIPYRANQPIKDMIYYIFSHASVSKQQRSLFIKVSSNGSKQLTNDMAVRAIAMCKHFVANPQQYAHSLDNIHFQILRRMWLQTFRHLHKQKDYPDVEGDWKYLGITYKMLSIENGFLDELLRVTIEGDFYETADDMVKVREGIGLRERRRHIVDRGLMSEGNKHFEYLCGLE